jgi:cytochrome c-type biogenesis protein CcmE
VNKVRTQKGAKIFLVIFLAAVGAALILFSLNNKLDYFYSPKDLESIEAPSGNFKLGGMVQVGSIKLNGTQTSFILTDFESSIKVKYTGVTPDLFKENSGAVVYGYLDAKEFIALELYAKHDENYMPPAMLNLE